MPPEVTLNECTVTSKIPAAFQQMFKTSFKYNGHVYRDIKDSCRLSTVGNQSKKTICKTVNPKLLLQSKGCIGNKIFANVSLRSFIKVIITRHEIVIILILQPLHSKSMFANLKGQDHIYGICEKTGQNHVQIYSNLLNNIKAQNFDFRKH